MISRTHRNNRGLALWAKLLIGFFAFCLIAILSICAVMGFLWYQAVNPDNVKKVLGEMVELEPLPPDISYTLAFDFPNFARIAVLNQKPPAKDVMVLVGFPNKSQVSAKEFVEAFTGKTSASSEEADNMSKDEKAAQKVKDKTKSETESKKNQSKNTDSASTETDKVKVSSEDPDDKTVEDLQKHTQSPRGSNLDVQKQGEITIGGVKSPYIVGQAVNKRTGEATDQTAVFISAALSPNTNHIIMPVLVQGNSSFDFDKGQKFLNLIKAFKDPTSKADQ